MSLPLYLAFLVTAAVVVVIPGPTVLLMVGYGLSEGRRSLWALVAGVVLGDVVACAGSMLGLGTLLAASAQAFAVVKIIGAVYLVWLGLGMLRAGKAPAQRPSCSPGRKFAHAFAVTALNPKSILFFVAFLPQFVSHDAPIGPQLALLGATFVVLGAANAAAYGMLSSSAGDRIQDPRWIVRLRRTGGGVLIGAGVLAVTARR